MTIYTEKEIRELLNRDEGQFIEFKSLWDRSDINVPRTIDRRLVRDFIAENVAAFTNAEGGDLLLGVDDDGTPSGHDYPNNAVEEFFAVSHRRLQPPVQVRAQRNSIDGHEILVISVGVSERAVLVEGNGFPFRVGDQVLCEREEAINARKDAYRRVGFEQMIRREAGLIDLDIDLARALLGHTVRGSRSVEEVLEIYGLAHKGLEGFRITNAALLLFGRSPNTRWHPHADIRFFRVKGKERLHGTRRNVTQLGRFDLPISRLIPEGFQFASAQIRKSERLHNLFFREMPEYPEFAWQEALVNAVAHRDYGNQTAGIEIWFYDDRMEIISPGNLVPPVTVEALRSRLPIHASRNPLIVRVLVEAGIMREEGEGIPRMFDETEAVFLKPPSFTDESGFFRVTLYNTPVFEGAGPEWQQIVDRLSLKTGQRKILLLQPEGFTNQDYRKANVALNRDQAYQEIQEMVALGIILPPKKLGRGARYHLAPNILRNKLWLEQRIPMLRDFFAKNEFLKNVDYRRLFKAPRFRAVHELGYLSAEGYLVREGERRGTRYRKGPRLLGSQSI